MRKNWAATIRPGRTRRSIMTARQWRNLAKAHARLQGMQDDALVVYHNAPSNAKRTLRAA